DEEQHVLAFLVAEVLGESQPGQAHPGARSRRFVHLAINERRFRTGAVELDPARFDHLIIEIVALARALAHTGENRVTAMRLGDVVDQLHDDHGLADARTAEQSDLAATRVWRQQIHDLDAGDQDLRFGRLLDEFRRGSVDRRGLSGGHRTALVDRITDHVDDAPQRLRPDRDRNGAAGIDYFPPAHKAVGRIHGDATYRVLDQMLRHFEHEGLALILHMQRIQDQRQLAIELNVD